jgi:hypothetical protein
MVLIILQKVEEKTDQEVLLWFKYTGIWGKSQVEKELPHWQ